MAREYNTRPWNPNSPWRSHIPHHTQLVKGTKYISLYLSSAHGLTFLIQQDALCVLLRTPDLCKGNLQNIVGRAEGRAYSDLNKGGNGLHTIVDHTKGHHGIFSSYKTASLSTNSVSFFLPHLRSPEGWDYSVRHHAWQKLSYFHIQFH